MASQEGCITVNWEIRNFSVLFKAKECRRFTSPNWLVKDTEGREWNNELHAHHYGSEIEFITVPTPFLHFDRKEMSFISSCGVVLLKKDPSYGCFYLEKNDLLNKSSESILLDDTITLCCRMWGKKLRTSELNLTTVLHSLNHLWTIEKLASSDSHDTCIELENFKLHVSLRKHGNCDWFGIVEFKPCAPEDLLILDCAVSVKNGFERFIIYRLKTYPKNSRFLFHFDIGSNKIGVTLQIEVIVALHGRHELSASSQVVRGAQLKPNSPTNIAKHKNVSGALGDDLLLLYRESALSDATLNTAGKSFSAHRNILAARSTVFRAMFEKDETSEGRSGVVDIDDVDSATVDRMLVYLYGDSVGDLAWKEASALYYAADKYAILPLKEKCADFLKACLAADNACDGLVLADRHSDQELMTHVVNFILGHEEVVSSAQWEELEKGNPMLCAKIATQLFLKKGKKMRVQLKSKSPTNIAEHKNVSGALGDDLLLLYRESALSDATLNTADKSFSAHRTILAARSTVFRAMFEKDETSEGRSGVVDIDDVDSETVDRMLVYLYGDSVGDLAWSEASALYYAADKYAILPLKKKCADLMKACLAANNACDGLVLADRHSDQELMTHVVNFILGHEEVVSSAQWGELEKGNPILCAKIATQLFLKSRKK